MYLVENGLYDAAMTLCISLWVVNIITIHKKPFDFPYLNCSCFLAFAYLAMLNIYQICSKFYQMVPKMNKGVNLNCGCNLKWIFVQV